MTIELTRILPDDALSQFRVRDMRPDEIITVTCENVAEFNKSRQSAQNARRSANRLDGYEYRIESNSAANTIKVSLFKEEKKESEVSDE